jgi:hypothetical protein
LVLILIGGFVYSCLLGDTLRFRDEGHYLSLARNMIDHGTFSYEDNGIVPTAFHPPGYPIILASLMAVNGGILAQRMLNFAALACCALFMVRILRSQGSVVGARWAPVLILCYPVLFFTAGTLYPQIIAAALFLLILLMIEAYRLTRVRMIAVGMVQGFLLLVSPNFILVLPLVLAMPYILRKSVPLSHVLYVTAGVMLILTPWVARNYLTFHRFVVLSTNGGKTLLLGNSENSEPNKGESIDISKYDAEAEARGLSEVDTDQFYKRKALEWIGKNPAKASALYLAKLLNYFNYKNELATKSEQSRLRDLVMLLTYYPLLILVLFRLCLIGRSPLTRLEVVLLSFYVMSALTNAVFLPRIRYRLPFDALLICLAAFSFDHLKAWIGETRLVAFRSACVRSDGGEAS